MAVMNRILFVDDDIDILRLLKNGLKSMQDEWDMHFAEGGREAIALMQQGPFDVLITDLLMPELDGISLLNAVMKKYPNTIRFVLSGASDQEIRLKSVNRSHQLLNKSIAMAELKSMILQDSNKFSSYDNQQEVK